MNFEDVLAQQLKNNCEIVWILTDQLYGDGEDLRQNYTIMREREIFFQESLRTLNRWSFRSMVRREHQEEQEGGDQVG